MNKKNGLSRYRQEKIMRAFCADLTATQAALILDINRNTANRYYGLFRRAIHAQQEAQRAKIFGIIEVDESYFGATRPRGAPTKRKRGRGTAKQPVFGIFERGGRVYTSDRPRLQKEDITGAYQGARGPGVRRHLRRLARLQRPGARRL